MYNIAVTGVGGGVGQSILKSLEGSGYNIIALDGELLGAGLYAAKKAYLVIAYNIEKSDEDASKNLSDLFLACEKKGITFVALSASADELIDEFRHENNIMFPYHFTDETTLKTIIRSNPGLVKIEEGTIRGKWHFNDFPSIEKLTK